jgi:hypothetical protein
MALSERVYSFQIPSFCECEELKHLALCEVSTRDLVESVVHAVNVAKPERVIDVLDAVLMCLETSVDIHMRRVSLDMVYNLTRGGVTAELLELRAVTAIVRIGRAEMRTHSTVVLCCLNVLFPLAACASNRSRNLFLAQEGVTFAEEVDRFYNKSQNFRKIARCIKEENAKYVAVSPAQRNHADVVAAELLLEEEVCRAAEQCKLSQQQHKVMKKRSKKPRKHTEKQCVVQTKTAPDERLDDEWDEPAYVVNDEQELVLSCVLQVLDDRRLVMDFMERFLTV